MTTSELKNKLRDALAQSASGPKPLSEREAIDAALDVASEWTMRSADLDDEEAD